MGKQVGFLANETELSILDEFIFKHKLNVIGSPQLTDPPTLLKSIHEHFHLDYKFKFNLYIIRNEDLPLIKNRYIEQQNYYMIEHMNSPVIELKKTKIEQETKTLKAGRLYYDNGFYDNQRNFINHPSDFLNLASEFLKHIKNTFPHKTAYNNYSSDSCYNLLKNGWGIGNW